MQRLFGGGRARLFFGGVEFVAVVVAVFVRSLSSPVAAGAKICRRG